MKIILICFVTIAFVSACNSGGSGSGSDSAATPPGSSTPGTPPTNTTPGEFSSADLQKVEAPAQPGLTVNQFSRDPDGTNAFTAVRVDIAPFIPIDINFFRDVTAEAFAEGQITVLFEQEGRSLLEQEFEYTEDGTTFRFLMEGWFDADGAHFIVFGGTPEEFDAVGGRDLLAFLNEGSQPDLPAADAAIADDAILAEAGGERLTGNIVNDTITLAEIFAGAQLSPEQVKTLVDAIVEDFTNDPAQTIASSSNQAQVIADFQALNFVEQAEVRTNIITTLYLEAQQDDEQAEFLAIIAPSNRVLAFDSESQQVFTSQAARSLLRSNLFVAEVSGFEGLSQDEIEARIVSLGEEFDSIPAEQRNLLINGELNFTRLVTSWYSNDDAGREEIVARITSQATTPELVPDTARAVEQQAANDTSLDAIRGAEEQALQITRGFANISPIFLIN